MIRIDEYINLLSLFEATSALGQMSNKGRKTISANRVPIMTIDSSVIYIKRVRLIRVELMNLVTCFLFWRPLQNQGKGSRRLEIKITKVCIVAPDSRVWCTRSILA